MTADLGELWRGLARDDAATLLRDARPGLVVAADGRRLLFANAAARRFLRLGAATPLDGVVLDPRIADRLVRFAAGTTATARELLRLSAGLKPLMIDLALARPAGAEAIVATLSGTATAPADAAPEASLAGLVAPGGMVALFDGAGDVVAASGDHTAVEGLDDDLESLLDEAETAAVATRDIARDGEIRTVALLALGHGHDADRLLWIGPAAPFAATAVPAPAAARIAAETAEVAPPASAPVTPEPLTAVDVAQPPSDEPDLDDAFLMPPEPAHPVAPAETLASLAADPTPADVFLEDAYDDALFVAAAPLALDAWDEDAADAAWSRHAEAPPTPAAIVNAPAAAPAIPDEPTAAATVGTTGPEADTAGVAPAPIAATIPLAVAEATVAPELVENTTTAAPATSAPSTEIATSEAPAEPAALRAPAEAVAEPPVAEPPVAAPTNAADESDGFRFAAPGHPVKFVWLMDAERRFTMVSPELAEVVGPAVTRVVGRSWSEIAEELGFDDDGHIAEALARRDTWSGRTVLWPVEGEALRVPVDLAALPAFDRGRVFSGFRGFGTARADEQVPDPTAIGLRLRDVAPSSAPAPVAPAHTPAVAAPVTAPLAAVPAEAIAPGPVSVETPRATPPAPLVDEPVALPQTPVRTAPIVTPAAAAADATAAIPASDEPPTWPDDSEVALVADHDDAPETHEIEPAFAGEIAETIAGLATAPEPTPEPATEPAAAPTPEPATPRLPTETAVAEAPIVVAPEPAPPAATTFRPTVPPAATRETAAIAAAVAAFTAAGAPKTGPARADAPVGDALPATPRAEPGDRVVPHPRGAAPTGDVRLSQPERLAFRQIAEALGARIEGEPAVPPAGEATAAKAAAPSTPAAASAETPPASAADLTPAPARVEPPVIVFDAPPAATTPTVVEPATEAPVAVETPAAPAAEPPAVAAPAPLAATAPKPAAAAASPRAAIRAGDVRLLDGLPVAVAVVKDDTLAYANQRFLALLRYPDLAALEAAGGLDSLFAGEHVARRWQPGEAGRPMPIIAADGTLVPAEANLAPIPWGESSALLMTLIEVAPVPAATPAAASTPSAEPSTPTPLAAPAAEPTAEPAAPLVEPAVASAAIAAPPASNVVSLPAVARAADAERIAELEAVVDTATDGMLMLDADGIVLSANAGAEALFGCERRTMIGRPLTDRLAPESRRSALDYLDGLARNGVASVLNDGREVIGAVEPEGLIPLFMTIGAVTSGATRKYCVVLRDITQWKKAEEDLTTARRRAEEASVHKSDFLAKISHEIRTPLNAIIGFSELMMDERFGPVGNERYKDYLRDIHVSGSHIMSLVNDLLDLSKVEAGKMDLRFEAVGLADIVSECVAMMQPQANRERIIIRSSLPVGVPPVVADPRSIRQVVLNLLSNAIKFTPAGGQVIVSTTAEDNGEVVLRVRDTGYGMTDKEMQTAMEPFRQLHTTRSRAGGTGLGLPLTKALVEANRAVFRIDSTVGQGTLVSIAFPVTRVLAS